ncbi:hypothetical protein FBEOM_7174 [Fusarium beomiforme]|uniref:Uncharacterized protein n=1 Tax=Fusarium beomiforme TaxID=44412 RepID=A0A9P5AHX7_9HYPO|nr:hypothetical protein FBEOM_7174 [Fusarium beomiforme]
MRPDKPGAETFRVYHPELDNSRHAQDVLGLKLSGSCAHHYRWRLPTFQHRLALPSWPKYPDSINDTSDQNISTYLIDAGLWTACRESRIMIKKAFGTNQTSAKRYLGPRQAFTSPVFDDILNFNWGFLDDLFFYISPNHHPDVFDIGIEYNQQWGLESYEDYNDDDDDDSFAINKSYGLDEETTYFNIWLVDHNLKQRKGAPPHKNNNNDAYSSPSMRVPFHASDRKFLKVDLE